MINQLKCFLSIFTLTFSSVLFSQSWQPIGPYGGTPSNFMIDGDKVLVGGMSSVYESTDRGFTFNNISNNLPYNPYITLNSNVSYVFSQGTIKLAVLRGVGLYYTTNGVKAWKKTSANVVDNGFYCSFVAFGNTILLADETKFNKSSDGGATWTNLTQPFGATPIQSLYRHKNSIFAISLYTPYEYAQSNDTGKTWTKVTSFPSTNVSRLFSNGQTLFAYDGSLQSSTNDGVNWTKLTGKVSCAQMTMTRNVFYLATGGNVYTNIYRYSVGDTNWVSIKGKLGDGYAQGLCAYGDTVLFAKNDSFFRSVNGGKNWLPVNQQLKLTLFKPYALYASNAKLFLCFKGHYYEYSNNGATLLQHNLGSYSDVIGYKELILEAYYSGGVTATSYATPVRQFRGYGWNGLKYKNINNQIYSFNGPGNYTVARLKRRSDTLYVEDIRPYNPYQVTNILDIENIDDSLFLIANNETAPNGPSMIMATDTLNAKNWKGLFYLDVVRTLTKLKTYNNILYAGSIANGVYRTTTHCRTFTKANTGMGNRRVYCLNVFDDTLFAGTDTGLYYMTRTDTVWRLSGNLSGLHVVELTKNDHYFYALTNVGVYRLAYGPVSSHQKQNVVPSVLLFPNPASHQIVIDSKIKDEPVFIYNLTGEILYNGFSQMNGTAVDISGWPSGLYIVRCGYANGKFVKVE